MLKIRLQRHGKKGHPVYRIVVVDSRAPRDGGNVVEFLGHYDPQACGQACVYDIKIDRVDHWLSVGAQPSDTVTNLIKRARKQTPENGTVQSFAAA
ncbi:MAG: 30S ribosomal protein S16 [Verrucomicrobia bacterium CG_4_10_14_3_um_filter_43_23]|nr:MAG: 30S ribosomal protein S16 [Verrucomicrobia bacterium CG1_02_43_26]PIP59158.1 MAG: 30S ribosomal protein S16 [Verrucomicrobia bacterium CG22_combo_CG10-13_8_21_14_all_43_17]PIX58031.1 MAG: 30S ribosomal protein S16 [Verrucomicrobia bacterium CG_4_10_14_3_um_filter_43_23]PIY62266.1 MAG: 30S ribosomal protein S16 [Verrucomicrobia bacterium CG_4_10_14_0_8_um_filter_43_34]PJA43764.1 MAG: 30S ribosomal protein S16 [Verrucomicrobia bacterium CG_4_9_14_3_um_filter_43_20]